MNADKEAQDKFNQLLNFSNNMDRNFDDITRDMRRYKETIKRKKMIDKMGGDYKKKKNNGRTSSWFDRTPCGAWNDSDSSGSG